MRHLGLVRKRVHAAQWRDLLLVEVLGRVIKNTIRNKQRQKMEEVRICEKRAILRAKGITFRAKSEILRAKRSWRAKALLRANNGAFALFVISGKQAKDEVRKSAYFFLGFLFRYFMGVNFLIFLKLLLCYYCSSFFV